jgi:predicted  nucleic acid-binding Zn-ribbon protein
MLVEQIHEQQQLLSRINTRRGMAESRLGSSRFAREELEKATARLDKEQEKLGPLEKEVAEIDRQSGEIQEKMLEA